MAGERVSPPWSWRRAEVDLGRPSIVRLPLPGRVELAVDLLDPERLAACTIDGPSGLVALQHLLGAGWVEAVASGRPGDPPRLAKTWARLVVVTGLGSYVPWTTDPLVHDLDVALAWNGLGMATAASRWLDVEEGRTSPAASALLVAWLTDRLPAAAGPDVRALARLVAERGGDEAERARRVLTEDDHGSTDAPAPGSPDADDDPLRAAFAAWRRAMVREAWGDDVGAGVMRGVAGDRLADIPHEERSVGARLAVLLQARPRRHWSVSLGELVRAIGGVVDDDR